jgi:hypothetical protein
VLRTGTESTIPEAIDRETFQKMWKLSEPGTPSEHCFMRLPQTEYYTHTLSDDELANHHLNWYPDVRHWFHLEVMMLFLTMSLLYVKIVQISSFIRGSFPYRRTVWRIIHDSHDRHACLPASPALDVPSSRRQTHSRHGPTHQSDS